MTNTLITATPLDTALARFESLLNQELFVGSWLTVTQETIDKFAQVTLDEQWIHTDPKRAAIESPFKCTIAHGFLTLSLIAHLTKEMYETRDEFSSATMAVNYGLNKIRFPYPVRVNSNVRARVRLTAVSSIRKGLELALEVTVDLDNSRRPGCIAESVVRLYYDDKPSRVNDA